MKGKSPYFFSDIFSTSYKRLVCQGSKQPYWRRNDVQWRKTDCAHRWTILHLCSVLLPWKRANFHSCERQVHYHVTTSCWIRKSTRCFVFRRRIQAERRWRHHGAGYQRSWHCERLHGSISQLFWRVLDLKPWKLPSKQIFFPLFSFDFLLRTWGKIQAEIELRC